MTRDLLVDPMALEQMSREELLAYVGHLEQKVADKGSRSDEYERVYLESLLPTLIYDCLTFQILY